MERDVLTQNKIATFSVTVLKFLDLILILLGDDAAEERDVDSQILRQRVEAAHGSEVNQAVSGLLTELDRYTPYEDKENVFKGFYVILM